MKLWTCYCGMTTLTETQYSTAKFDRCPYCRQQLINFKSKTILEPEPRFDDVYRKGVENMEKEIGGIEVSTRQTKR